MKLFAAICGTAALVTAAVNHRILSRFDAMYGYLETPLPGLTRALLWKSGLIATGLLLASAVTVFTGLLRKNNPLMVTGGVSAIVLMLGAATVIPTALMLPLEKALDRSDDETPLPRPAAISVKNNATRN